MEKEKLEKKEEIKSKKMEYTELSQFVTRIGSLVQTNYIGSFTTEFPIYVQRKINKRGSFSSVAVFGWKFLDITTQYKFAKYIDTCPAL